MSSDGTGHDVRARILAALDHADWDYDEEADELEILLPGGEYREGYMVLVEDGDDDFYVRLDVETAEPLGIVIPVYRHWLANKLVRCGRAPVPRPRPDMWLDYPSRAARQALEQAVRCSRQLADVTVTRS